MTTLDPAYPNDPYDDMERFWEATYPEHRRGCGNDCGACWRCGVKWALGWSFAVLSNPQLATEAEKLPPFKNALLKDAT